MTIPTQQLIQSIIKRVIEAVQDENKAGLHTAKQLYWAQQVIDYSLTDYKSWGIFCKQEIPLGTSTITSYVRAARLIEKYQYTDAECLKMIAGIGWSRFQAGLPKLRKRLSVPKFIKLYKDLSNYTRGKFNANNKTVEGDSAYSFTLPFAESEKYKVHLTQHGAVFPDQGPRRGIRDAMIHIINEILK